MEYHRAAKINKPKQKLPYGTEVNSCVWGVKSSNNTYFKKVKKTEREQEKETLVYPLVYNQLTSTFDIICLGHSNS